jgi:uncharacterized protein
MPVVYPYAAVLALFFVGLSVRTLLLRRTLKIALGDGGAEPMLRAVRVHSNFAEYVPLALLLIHFTEQQGQAAWLVHALCIALIAGRTAHAFGVGRAPEDYRFRVAGMALTFTSIIVAALALLAGPLLLPTT